MRFLAALLAIVCAASLAACGEDRESSTGTSTTEKTDTEAAAEPTGKPVRTVEIAESEFKLKPNRVKLDKPGVYEFRAKNVGNTVHALEVEGKGTEAETEEIDSGQSKTLRAKLAAGKYKLYCPVANHEARGMVGTVTVGGGSSGGTSAPDTETESEDDSGGGGSGY